MQYDFGQPIDGIVQLAYTVADIRQSREHYVRRLGVGPWFLIEHFPGRDMRYRGAPTSLDMSLAMAFSGHTLLELIQQHDDGPSVYHDLTAGRRHGFHHWGVGSRDFATDVKRYRDMGYDEAFFAVTPAGDRVAYMDTTADLPGMVELIEMNEPTERLFTGFYQAAIGWDGRDPIRSFG